jgi:type I restriction enzyme S subunit
MELNKGATLGLPKRYKQTELGIIPVDWEIVELVKLTTRIGDGIHTTPQYNDNGDYYFVNGNNLVNGKIVINEETKKVSKEEYLFHKRDLSDDTILLSINGTIGNIAFYLGEKIVLGKSAAYININDKLDKKFFYQILQAAQIRKYFENELTGSTIKNLGLAVIRNTPIPLPPKKTEQTAIATALSDLDELFSQTEKLIDKKKAIKQGVIMELLKPKESWVTKKLGEIFKLSASSSKSSYIVDGGKYIIMDMGAVSSNGIILKTKRTDNNSDLLSYGDLVMPKDDIGGGNIIGKVGFIDKDASYVLGDHVYKLQANISTIDSLYFYYLINSVYVNKYLRSKASGSAQLGLGRKSVLEQELIYPKSIMEQTYAAEIISAMDLAILVLENKLHKLKLQKHGMMQALLTGKIRLQ